MIAGLYCLFLINQKASLSSSLFRNLRPNFLKNQLCLIPRENGDQAEMERLVFTLSFWRDKEQQTASLCTTVVYKAVG